jgi:hypothetical protein
VVVCNEVLALELIGYVAMPTLRINNACRAE